MSDTQINAAVDRLVDRMEKQAAVEDIKNAFNDFKSNASNYLAANDGLLGVASNAWKRPEVRNAVYGGGIGAGMGLLGSGRRPRGERTPFYDMLRGGLAGAAIGGGGTMALNAFKPGAGGSVKHTPEEIQAMIDSGDPTKLPPEIQQKMQGYMDDPTAARKFIKANTPVEPRSTAGRVVDAVAAVPDQVMGAAGDAAMTGADYHLYSSALGANAAAQGVGSINNALKSRNMSWIDRTNFDELTDNVVSDLPKTNVKDIDNVRRAMTNLSADDRKALLSSSSNLAKNFKYIDLSKQAPKVIGADPVNYLTNAAKDLDPEVAKKLTDDIGTFKRLQTQMEASAGGTLPSVLNSPTDLERAARGSRSAGTPNVRWKGVNPDNAWFDLTSAKRQMPAAVEGAKGLKSIPKVPFRLRNLLKGWASPITAATALGGEYAASAARDYLQESRDTTADEYRKLLELEFRNANK